MLHCSLIFSIWFAVVSIILHLIGMLHFLVGPYYIDNNVHNYVSNAYVIQYHSTSFEGAFNCCGIKQVQRYLLLKKIHLHNIFFPVSDFGVTVCKFVKNIAFQFASAWIYYRQDPL